MGIDVGGTGVLVGGTGVEVSDVGVGEAGKMISSILGEVTMIVMQPPMAVTKAASPASIPGIVSQNDLGSFFFLRWQKEVPR